MPVSAVERAISVAAQSAVWWRIYRGILIPVTVFLALALGWALAVKVTEIPPILLPSPLAVFDALLKQWDVLLKASAQTLTEIILATTIAIVAGFVTAILIGLNPSARRVVFPYILLTQVVPKVALAPILIAWFGIGMQSRLILAILIAYFPMVINTLTGILGTGEASLRYARSLAASDWQVLVKVRLPEALPSIVGGIKITVGAAVIGIVVGEFVATEGGLGKVIIDSAAVLNTALTIAATFLIGAIGLTLLGALELVEKRIIYWQAGR
jgi:NitT/TauT family transport system permease protein